MTARLLPQSIRGIFLGFLTLVSCSVQGEVPGVLEQLDAFPHLVRISQSSEDVRDHEVGLGAIQKIRGAWRFKESERLTGKLERHTWQVSDGFTSLEVLDKLEADLLALSDTTLQFSCSGRSCGQGVQWANRVFGERILYGREELQRYRVYSGQPGDTYRIILYAAARTADRQYLHLELLHLEPVD